VKWFHDNFTIRSEQSHSVMSCLLCFGNLQLGVSEAIPWWVACYVWEFTIRSEWSHSVMRCLLFLGIYNKEWAKPFHDELLVMFWEFTIRSEWVKKPFHDELLCYVWEFTIRSEQSHSMMSCLLCFGNLQLGVSEATPWQFTIGSEWSHSVMSCLLCLGIFNKEWVKPFHDNLQLGVSEAIPWWVACYVWEFTIRSEWSHSVMSCLLCLGIYNKEWGKPFRDEFACYVWVKARHVCKIPETAYVCSETTHQHLLVRKRSHFADTTHHHPCRKRSCLFCALVHERGKKENTISCCLGFAFKRLDLEHGYQWLFSQIWL